MCRWTVVSLSYGILNSPSSMAEPLQITIILFVLFVPECMESALIPLLSHDLSLYARCNDLSIFWHLTKCFLGQSIFWHVGVFPEVLERQIWVINRKRESGYREESLCNNYGSDTLQSRPCNVWMLGDGICVSQSGRTGSIVEREDSLNMKVCWPQTSPVLNCRWKILWYCILCSVE